MADSVPAVPIALVPDTTVATAEAARARSPRRSRSATPSSRSARAALLGAGLASGSSDVFAAALNDRLHEPYRAANAPLLAEVRDELPAGALGATISGLGPDGDRLGATRTRPRSARSSSPTASPSVEVLWLSTSAKGAELVR